MGRMLTYLPGLMRSAWLNRHMLSILNCKDLGKTLTSVSVCFHLRASCGEGTVLCKTVTGRRWLLFSGSSARPTEDREGSAAGRVVRVQRGTGASGQGGLSDLVASHPLPSGASRHFPPII